MRRAFLVISVLLLAFSFLSCFVLAADFQNAHFTSNASVYSGPSFSSTVYSSASSGEALCVYGEYLGWYEIGYGGRTGYVLQECVSIDFSYNYIVSVDEETVISPPAYTPVPTFSPSPIPSPTTTPNTISLNSIVELAKGYIGVPYKWGGTTTEGMDCSGFVQTVYSDAGYSIGRTTQLQALEGTEVTEYEPGDILCFGRSKWNVFHTGIYIGDGKFIHASSPEGVVTTELEGYGLKLIMGRRLSNED